MSLTHPLLFPMGFLACSYPAMSASNFISGNVWLFDNRNAIISVISPAHTLILHGVVC